MITRSKIKNDNKGNDDDSDDEEYTPSKRRKIIVDFITDIVNKNINIEIDTDESEDEYDKEFEELENSNEIDSNDINLEYFKKLKLHQKKLIIKNIKDINVINENSIPIKFKVLESNANILTKSIAIQQIDKITDMDPSSGEYSKTEQWISGLIKIPFNHNIKLPINNDSELSEKNKFLQTTNDILNHAIYGHNDAKSHILQVLGKWIKNPDSNGNILALQGPMGNGKTTLVKEGIAKAINRPFAFIALGGASDSSFFDGHNFTYEGSRWGRIVEILMQSKCMNPIIYFDELDKVSNTYKGQEIIHLLTHLTDQSQNDKFHDNYFSGIDIDLSKVLFIFSFNDESRIDPILKDRMYVINTKGFSIDDKLQITRNYLLPQLLESYKYHDSIIFTDDIIHHIIEKYTGKEEGVRNLKRCIDTILSKVNMYEMLYDKQSKLSSIKLPYTLSDFTIPYNVNEQDLKELLKKRDEFGPPEHMYV
jgi:ATP-dependent Lon protease